LGLISIYNKINVKYFTMKLTKDQLMGIVRHVITFVGGILITKGLIDDSILTEIVGGSVALSGAIWSIVSKNKSN